MSDLTPSSEVVAAEPVVVPAPCVADPVFTRKRADVVHLSQGDAVLFAVNHRPSFAGRGSGKTAMRHVVSRVHWGVRHTIGIIFHDAR